MSAGRTTRRRLSRSKLRRKLADADQATPRWAGPVDTLHEAYMLGQVLVVVPRLLESMPPDVRHAVATRREATFTGRCPTCRAHRNLRSAHRAEISHIADCPASDLALAEVVARTGWQP